ncbi:Crp/Fnr family transcriptional regulator [filamentous cyanobacterium LEGE 11480]|uniref:Crp/Fnr family transcriptional regulator n=1 Tax=Romeriopsis navalis LEGE 11480 TaxID=2777977 RepID=A0A928VWB6_9CYAN|nr:Crp/Fnr family transcriptional regulator [Romeriopsis navalis]MBE9033359.1 Crp/Fnr family transcriptional regulator [Romeriopsis navalis LEGE 11480]
MLQSQPYDRTLDSLSSEAHQQLDRLSRTSAAKTYKRGSHIPLHTDCIWIVRQGLIQLGSLYPNGEESLLGIISPTMPFGLPLTKVDPYNAVALTDVVLIKQTMSQIQQSSSLSQLIHQQSTYRLRQTEAILAMLGYRRIEDRLRQFLILLAGEIGETTPNGIRLSVRLTHQIIANATGTTRVTTTRLLGVLKQEGWLSLDARNHIVLTRSLMQ